MNAIKHANIPINAGFGMNRNDAKHQNGWRFLSIMAEIMITRLFS
jgi:hypothetical protein